MVAVVAWLTTYESLTPHSSLKPGRDVKSRDAVSVETWRYEAQEPAS